jgi:hypothetical protein
MPGTSALLGPPIESDEEDAGQEFEPEEGEEDDDIDDEEDDEGEDSWFPNCWCILMLTCLVIVKQMRMTTKRSVPPLRKNLSLASNGASSVHQSFHGCHFMTVMLYDHTVCITTLLNNLSHHYCC